jgi:hypothetical protein
MAVGGEPLLVAGDAAMIAEPGAAANPAGASRLQSLRPVRRVAELGSLGRFERFREKTKHASFRSRSLGSFSRGFEPKRGSDSASSGHRNSEGDCHDEGGSRGRGRTPQQAQRRKGLPILLAADTFCFR